MHKFIGSEKPLGLNQSELGNLNLRVERLNHEEELSAYCEAVKYLVKPKLKSGPQYKIKWEEGWSFNLEKYKKTKEINDLIPVYLKKNKIFRINGQYCKSPNVNFELDFARLIITHYVSKYLEPCQTIVDLGSGSCHYLYWLASRFTKKEFWSLDWAKASNDIALNLSKEGLQIKSFNFNMFEPKTLDHERNNSKGLISIGSLEQIGTKFKPLVDWIKTERFQIILNIEPIYEFYNREILFDFLPSEYLLHRNWLRGYLPYLEKLERVGEIRILEKRRIFGSHFHETYNVIVWQFVNC